MVNIALTSHWFIQLKFQFILGLVLVPGNRTCSFRFNFSCLFRINVRKYVLLFFSLVLLDVPRLKKNVLLLHNFSQKGDSIIFLSIFLWIFWCCTSLLFRSISTFAGHSLSSDKCVTFVVFMVNQILVMWSVNMFYNLYKWDLYMGEAQFVMIRRCV